MQSTSGQAGQAHAKVSRQRLITRTAPILRSLIPCLLCLILSAAAGRADTPFEQARSLWLVGDDALSLPILADLARERDSRARILLARIETMDKGPSPYRMNLTREETRALFRNIDAGRFGRSWLSVEAQLGNDLAVAFLDARAPRPDPALVERLVQLGEIQATDHPSRIIALYGSTEDVAALRDSGALLEDLEPYLAYLHSRPEPRGDGLMALRHIAGPLAESVAVDDQDTLAMAGLLALGYGFGDTQADNPWRPVVEDWLMQSPSTRPIADLCSASCAEEARGCAFAFMALTGGYYEVIRLDSPTETFIPQDEFLASPRARIMALRRAALARQETNAGWVADTDQIAQISQCAADMIAEVRKSYNAP